MPKSSRVPQAQEPAVSDGNFRVSLMRASGHHAAQHKAPPRHWLYVESERAKGGRPSRNSNGGMGSVRFGRPSRNDRYLREADDRSRRVADRGLGRLNWADSARTGIAPGRTGVRAFAAIRLRARSTLHRPKRPYAKRFISACASAISGICGVGAKPSSAGARTA